MLDLLDRQQSLTINQWKIFTACLFSIVIDFFDFGLIGFVLAFFVKDWHLTFGQSGAILFASGVAAVPGGIFFGWLGDKIGRRTVFMMMILTLSFATGVMALAPEHGWIFIATMRFIVGLGSADWPLSICRCCRNSCRPPSAAGSAACRSVCCRWGRCWRRCSAPRSAR